MALCEARRQELGYSKRDVARRVSVDAADVARALNLKSATPRTVNALVRYFEVGDAAELKAGEREQAILLEMKAHHERNAKLLGDLAALRTASGIGD